MLFLKKFKAIGFKSFANPIELTFENSMIGVVGPNGSGKSNIVDAIKWVMGEQSVKTLRGSNSMTDVIFSGSSSRPASNLASVCIVFDNTNRTLNVDYNEIKGLSLEARQKLNNIKPLSIGQASRISGVSPADINVLFIYLEKRKRQ